MNALWKWLSIDIGAKKVCGVIILAIIVKLLFVLVGIWIIKYFNVYVPPTPISREEIPLLRLSFLFWLLYVAILEEAMYHLLPLVFTMELLGGSKRAMIAVVVISSAIFGWVHGGFTHIFIQGVSGFILCLVFLKCGGLQRKYVKALTASAAVHFLFNGFICLARVVAGARYL